MSVAACLRGGTRVDVAWNLDPERTPGFDADEAAAFTPGGGRLGGLLNGALDSRLLEVAAAKPTDGRVVTTELTDLEAGLIGVDPGTRLRIAIAPADLLPEAMWPELLARQPVTITATTDGDRFSAVRLMNDGDTATETGADSTLTTRFAPTPTLVVLGGGPMSEAVARAGAFVGWRVEAATGPDAAVGLAAGLSPIDGIVVTGHDTEAVGRVLQSALGSGAGYIGSIGPRDLQESRADWLAYRGIVDTGRISAPAGIDIGARGPEQVAISVVAEMIAHTSGATRPND